MRFLGKYYVMLFAAALSALPLDAMAADTAGKAFAASGIGSAACIAATKAAANYLDRAKTLRDKAKEATENGKTGDGIDQNSTPANLPANPNGAIPGEATSTGINSAEQLERMAKGEDAKAAAETAQALKDCASAPENKDTGHQAQGGGEDKPPPPPPPKSDSPKESSSPSPSPQTPPPSPSPSTSPLPLNSPSPAPSIDVRGLTFNPSTAKKPATSGVTNDSLAANNQARLDLASIPTSMAPSNPNSYVATTRPATAPASATLKPGSGQSGFGVAPPTNSAPNVASNSSSGARIVDSWNRAATNNRGVTGGGNTWVPDAQSMLLKNAQVKSGSLAGSRPPQGQLAFANERAGRGVRRAYSTRSSYTGRGAQYAVVDIPRSLQVLMNRQYLARGSTPTLRIKAAPAGYVAPRPPVYSAPRMVFEGGMIPGSLRRPAATAPSHYQTGAFGDID